MCGGKRVIGLIFGLLVLQIAACASQEVHFINEKTDAKGKPQWATQGTTTLKSKRGRAFLAVGTAPTEGDFSTQASVASQRAKLQAELILSRFFEVVSRDYIATGSAESAGYTAQDVSLNVNKTTSIILPYMQIMEHWHDAENNKIYAITAMDYRQVIERVIAAASVNTGFKAYFTAQGETIFDRIATQR